MLQYKLGLIQSPSKLMKSFPVAASVGFRARYMCVLDCLQTLGIIFLLNIQCSLVNVGVLLVVVGFISILKIYSGHIFQFCKKRKLIHFHI